MAKILSTKNYDQFKQILGNRELIISHVNHLIKLNSVDNSLWQYPGLISADGYLVDGQHRLAAARANDWDFFYTISARESKDLMVGILNTAQRSWSIVNFINYYATNGNKQYQFVIDCLTEFRLSQAIVLALFNKKSGYQTHAIKNGNLVLFEIEGEKVALHDIVSAYSELKPFVSTIVFTDREFAIAIRKSFSVLSVKEIIVALQKTKDEIEPARYIPDYLRQLEVIVNKGKHAGNEIRLF